MPSTSPLSAALWACLVAACPPREPRPTTPAATTPDPRVAVTAWSQIERFHCARGADGRPRACARDADCAQGAVCDTSGGCGCCVQPPPRLDPGATLHRYLFTACEAGRCAPPRFCEASGDGTTCTMRFDREVPLWMTRWTPPDVADPRAEALRAMCVRVEPGQDCMWRMDVPGGEYTADAPFPTRYTGSYECGGRTCNGHDAVRASPRVGSSTTVRVAWHRCGSR